jgi:predicted transport protein
MKANDEQFTKIINGTCQFVIPVFQRDYTWQAEPQCAQLWRDIVRVAGTIEKHFIGSIVYIATDDTSAGFTRWLLIDGQQRLATLMILLTALRDHIAETGWKGDPTPSRVDAYFLKNIQEERDREQKLVLRRRDQATLRSLLDRTELPHEFSERIRENYNYFREQLVETNPGDVYRGIGCLVIVDVRLDRHIDDPQLIFESLNSTGVDLSQSDLIRNFILMKLPEAIQTKLYEGYWSKIEALFRGSEWTFDAFARDFVALMTQAAKQEKAAEIYYAFRKFFPGLQQKMGGLDEALGHILRYARYYASFVLAREVSAQLGPYLARLRHLVDVPGLLVMRLFDCHDRGTLTESQFIEALELVESYVLRRAICGYQTRGYWQIFAALAYKLDQENPLTSLKVGLARQRENYRFPSDKEFEGKLKGGDVYGLRVCRHLLEGLENYGTKEPSDTSSYSIEHILPQNERLPPEWQTMLGANWREVQKVWLHRLGNLTLTGYNTKYSDRPFEEKKTMTGGFADSAVRLNKFVREQPKWTAQEISARIDILAERSITLWPMLHVSQPQIEAANYRDMRELAARRDVGKVEMSAEARSLFDKLREHVFAINTDVLELAEPNSVSYHDPAFFLEVLPRRYTLTLLLALDFNEIDDPAGVAQDATQREFFIHARHQGGVAVSLSDEASLKKAIPLIRQAHAAACG